MSDDTEPCFGCSVGFHEECLDPTPHAEDGFFICCCYEADGSEKTKRPTIYLGGYKANDQIKDQTSTGRKRAAALYPIKDGMLCEWSGLKNAGGGVRPIVGCNQTRIYAQKGKGAIHHGPDKSTLNNEPENVHRICTRCHNRWHTLNDPEYPEFRPPHGAPFVPLDKEVMPHDPHTRATPEEMLKNEMMWQSGKTKELEAIEDGDEYESVGETIES